MQRALLQSANPQNFPLVRKALRLAGREDLIGTGKHCLVPPERPFRRPEKPEDRRRSAGPERRTERKPERKPERAPQPGKPGRTKPQPQKKKKR